MAHEESDEGRENLLRDQIIEVFGLTGGELEDEPRTFTHGEKLRTYQFWYTGFPEYVERKKQNSFGDCDVITLIDNNIYAKPPQILIDEGGRKWNLLDSFLSSGEVSCPFFTKKGNCSLCENEHTEDDVPYIYIGDGWAENVYISVVPNKDTEGSQEDTGD
jgi:hypothetical protein